MSIDRLPLAVDLDGTLIRTDLLHETATRFLVARPFSAWRLIPWLLAGRARLKSELASRTELDVGALPYDQDVLAWLRDEALDGRQLALVSASHESLVTAVADHLGLFSVALGSTSEHNLRSERKAAALAERYGDHGFEYLGNHRHDLHVWHVAAVAHVASGSDDLTRAVAARTTLGRTFASAGTPAKSLLHSARPHQWLKNLLVVVPLFTAQRMFDGYAVIAALSAFVAFCLVASSVYILNDLADLENDRHHPEKSNRSFAAGDASLLLGWALWPALVVLGFVLSLSVLPWEFTATLLCYFVITVAYTFVLKKHRVVDVTTLAALYTIRVIAGIAAISADYSMWLLTFSLFLFLSLALVKRVSELTRARQDGGEAKGRGYIDQDLEMLSSYGVASSMASAVIFALYLDDPATSRLYATPELLWGALPVLLTWLMRVWMLAHRGQINEDPILFAVRDRWSLFAAVALAAVFVAAKVVTL